MHSDVESMERRAERLHDALKEIIALATGPDRGSAAWQIEAAVEIAQKALERKS